MTEMIDHETGEITSLPLPPLPRPLPSMTPTPYQSGDTGQLATAMAAAQGEIETPKRTKEGEIKGMTKQGRDYAYKYKYAPFEEIQRVVKATFPKHGLMFQQGLVIRGDQFFVRTYIRHSSGEWTASDYPVIADRGGPQGFASATTYAKRYGLSLATGLAAEDDDDGAAARATAPQTVPATRATPAVAAPNADVAGLANVAVRRIRKEIGEAQSIEHLNGRGIFGPTAMTDEVLILRQAGGGAVWDDLVRRDADKRATLAVEPTEHRI